MLFLVQNECCCVAGAAVDHETPGVAAEIAGVGFGPKFFPFFVIFVGGQIPKKLKFVKSRVELFVLADEDVAILFALTNFVERQVGLDVPLLQLLGGDFCLDCHK
jgi:hypothetical protein